MSERCDLRVEVYSWKYVSRRVVFVVFFFGSTCSLYLVIITWYVRYDWWCWCDACLGEMLCLVNTMVMKHVIL